MVDVLHRLDSALDAESQAAAVRFEQAHVGLALLRACFVATETLDDALRPAVSSFCA